MDWWQGMPNTLSEVCGLLLGTSVHTSSWTQAMKVEIPGHADLH
jgi:hypothetical protein